ncbi:hypothetical protein ACFSKM_05870 [Ancylobacter dichloromethanicus]
MKVPGFSNLLRGTRERGSGARWRAALLAGCTALVLAGCNGGGGSSPMSKASKTLSPQTLALIQQKDMTKSSPIVVRIFKEESGWRSGRRPPAASTHCSRPTRSAAGPENWDRR